MDTYAHKLGSSVGNVRMSERRVAEISVEITDPVETAADEYVLVVNGRPVKRMNYYQAKRMGLVL